MRHDFFKFRDGHFATLCLGFPKFRSHAVIAGLLVFGFPAIASTLDCLSVYPIFANNLGTKNSFAAEIQSAEDDEQGGESRKGDAPQEKIGRGSRATDRSKAEAEKPGESPDPAEAAKERKAREAAKKRGELTFDDLKFEIEKGAPFKPEMLTDDNKDLHKKTWKIRGFILPTTLFSKSNIREFVLVRDNQECCFGPGAALYDCIMVKMAPGKSINFSTRVVAVKGVLEIDTESFLYPDSEEHYAIYKMIAEEVK